MPQLNPEAGTPTIQLVGPETSKEELQELYLEVYKLHRLPRSPPGEPVLLEEVPSSLEDHQGWKAEEAPTAMARRSLSLQKWCASERKERQLSGKKFGYSLGGLPKSTGHGGYP